MRLDKFIWATRLFKTRTISSKACTGEKVQLNDKFSKPSKTVAIGDIIAIKVIPIWKTYKIIGIPKSRVGAKLVPDLVIETTPEEDLEQLRSVQEANHENKVLGIKGRPTKKVRRDLDDWFD